MRLRAVFSVTLLVLAAAAPARSACDFSAVYFFGASNLDTGNFINHPHWGISQFAPTPAKGYWMGRWQSGPVWAEVFASGLGLPSAPSSEGGTNYSIGIAGTSPHPGETPLPPSDPNYDLYLQTQIDQALDDAAGALDPDALYVIEIGHNDPTVYSRTAEDGPDGGGVVVTQMGRLRSAGAVNFLVRLLGNGQEPYATPFNAAIVAGVETLRAGGATVYVVEHKHFATHELTVGNLANLGITQFGPGINCRANAGCQAGASAAAALDQSYDHAFLFFDVVTHWNHEVHAEIARHALAHIACSGAPWFADGFEHGNSSSWSSTAN